MSASRVTLMRVSSMSDSQVWVTNPGFEVTSPNLIGQMVRCNGVLHWSNRKSFHTCTVDDHLMNLLVLKHRKGRLHKWKNTLWDKSSNFKNNDWSAKSSRMRDAAAFRLIVATISMVRNLLWVHFGMCIETIWSQSSNLLPAKSLKHVVLITKRAETCAKWDRGHVTLKLRAKLCCQRGCWSPPVVKCLCTLPWRLSQRRNAMQACINSLLSLMTWAAAISSASSHTMLWLWCQHIRFLQWTWTICWGLLSWSSPSCGVHMLCNRDKSCDATSLWGWSLKLSFVD